MSKTKPTKATSEPQPAADPAIPEAYPDPQVEDAVEVSPIEVAPAEVEPEPAPEPERTMDQPAPERIVEQTVVRKGGAGAMILGGLVAAGLGYGAAWVTRPQVDTSALEQAIGQQAEQVSALKAELAEMVSADGLDAQIGEVGGRVDGLAQTIDGLAGRIGEVSAEVADRLSALEKRPVGDGSFDVSAIEAYEAEVTALKEEINRQNVDLQGMQSDAAARIERLEAAASEVQATSAQLQKQADDARAAAELAEKRAAARSALSKVEGALAQGGGYAEALEPISALLDVPQVLTDNAADGVTPLADLQKGYDTAARSALTAARAAGEAGDEGGGALTGFLRKQLSVRSSAPRDGDTVDAILSRVEAQLQAGRLGDVLKDIDGLPASAREALGDWLDRAATRQAVTAATADLSDQLTTK